MKALGRLLLLVVVSLSIGGCSFSDNIKLAEAAVEEFHAAFNAGDFESIMERAVDEMNEPEKRKTALEFFGEARSTLGVVVSTKQTNWSAKNSVGSDSRVELAYQTTYEHGRANESFVFVIRAEQALLWAYNLKTIETFKISDPEETVET